jgi:hypothetical protein
MWWHWLALLLTALYVLATLAQLFQPGPLRVAAVIELLILGLVWWLFSVPAVAGTALFLFLFGNQLVLMVAMLFSSGIKELGKAEPSKYSGNSIEKMSDRDLVRWCLAEVDRVESEASADLTPELIEYARGSIRKNPGAAVETVRVHGVTPRNMPWLLISNAAGEEVASGRHHVYRGILGLGGQDLRKSYLRAVSEMEVGGYYTPEKAKSDRDWLEKAIANA